MKIAITGLIGSGKSEVVSEVKRLGGFVLSADEINRNLLTSKSYLDRLKNHFPEAFKGGVFDKKELTRVVFFDDNKRKLLNSIAHPEILKVIQKESEGKETVFVEVPLLSKEWAEMFDTVWLVESDKKLRYERVKSRDSRSDSEIEAIFFAQSEYENIVYKSCVKISNRSTREDLAKRVAKEYIKIK